MTYLIVGLLMLASVASFFTWSYIHEMSHVIAARYTVGIEWYRLKLYPHKSEHGWYWASVSYMPLEMPTSKDKAIISLAPWVAGIIAAIAFPFCLLMPFWISVGWMIFWGGGVVDLINGSASDSAGADIIKASQHLDIPRWKLSLLGLLATPSVVAGGVWLGLRAMGL